MTPQPIRVHLTQLLFLRRNASLPAPPLQPRPRLTYRPYDPADSDLFRKTLRSTYQGSLDCPDPELNSVRDALFSVDGQGADLGLWRMALADGLPVGVLLLTRSPDGRDWEISYIGVTPEARRRGVGRELVRKAIFEAKAGGGACLTLSVDARNHPARALYEGLGFEIYDRRDVFLSVESVR